MNHLSESILYFFFPSRCPVCQGLLSYGQQIHPACLKKLSFPPEGICMRCGRPLLTPRNEYCTACGKQTEGPEISYRQARAVFLYQDGIRLSLYRFKYSNRREYAKFYALTAKFWLGSWIRQKAPDLILPVPMFASKKKRRGYNQAEVFAGALSRLLHIPCSDRLLIRKHETKALKTMGPKARRTELNRAFAVSPEYDPKAFPVILLVDDIFTTGATADALSRALRAAGARDVYVLTIATASAEIP